MRLFLLLFMLGVASCLSTEASGQSCSLPGQYVHFTSQIEDSIRITLATELDTYAIGDLVACYLLFENLGDSTYVIPNPSLITPMWAFQIVPDSCGSMYENGCFDVALFIAPGFVAHFGVPVVLESGECVSYEVEWDGVPWPGEVTPGSYALVAGMTTGGEFFFPSGGMRLDITIDGTVPATQVSWGRIKTMYGDPKALHSALPNYQP